MMKFHYLISLSGLLLDVLYLPEQFTAWNIWNEESDTAMVILDIQAKMKTFSEAEKSMISEIITICNLLLVNPATSAAGERSFSSARRLKTWLRSTMTQTRFSNLTILNTHKQRTDNLCLIDIANEFTALNDNRRKNFGTFKESDFKISGWLSSFLSVEFSLEVSQYIYFMIFC